MRSIQQGLKDEGFAVPMTKLCGWFEVARRTTCYKLTRVPAKINAELAAPIKEMIEAEPAFGYRTVVALLGMNKNTVQRIFPALGLAGSQAGLDLRDAGGRTRHDQCRGLATRDATLPTHAGREPIAGHRRALGAVGGCGSAALVCRRWQRDPLMPPSHLLRAARG